MVSTQTQIGQYKFEHCVMNASGVYCFDREELEAVDQSCAATFVTKTATPEARQGNPEPRYREVALGSINSMGLPNLGIDYYLEYLAEKEAANPNKPYFLSLTALSHSDIHDLLTKVQASDFQGLVELNLSCPNVIGKPQTAYDFPTTQHILEDTFSFFTKPLGVKLPPYFDPVHFDQMADILNQFPLHFVNCVNSIGNGLIVEDEHVLIHPKNGFGGIGGQYLKPTALANVHAFYTRLKDEIAIIGTGGVTCGRDVFEHILCGASMVQVGTQLMMEGPSLFQRLDEELKAIMAEKGYTDIADFRGKLQYVDAVSEK